MTIQFFLTAFMVVIVACGVFSAATRDYMLQSERVMTWLNRSFAVFAGRLALERA